MTKKTADKKAVDRPLAILAILDGFGLADSKDPGNAITPATAPTIFGLMKKYPSGKLAASGEAVGLFPNQEGNSEAGHMTIGAGRIVTQDLVRISDAIHDGTFYKNQAFKQALYHVKKYDTAVHLVGLLTDDNSAHARPEHLYALLELCRRENIKKVFLHLFTDGRDASPHQAPTFLHELRGHLLAHEKIATIAGRFFAMDRNKVWDRIHRAYEAIVLGKGCAATSAEEAITAAYNRDESDEFICPSVIQEDNLAAQAGKPVAVVKDNDAVIFFNARSDRARELTKTFVQPEFEKENPGAFTREKFPKNIRFVAMTDFGPDLPHVLTAFPSPEIPHALADAIDGAYRQLYISETEKYAHVTYFINGGHATPLDGEVREMVRSAAPHSYADRPQMQTAALLKKITHAIERDTFNFICVNFPNADMVGHTGNIAATKKAVRVVDTAIATLAELVLAHDGTLVVVGDHGNAEKMIQPNTHEMDTEHSTNPVPCIIVQKKLKHRALPPGGLSDVAPTLLHLLHLPVPKEMTGRNLLARDS